MAEERCYVAGGEEVVGEHHVRGDEKLVDCCVVRRAECGADHAGVFDGVAETVVGGCFGGSVGLARHGVTAGCYVSCMMCFVSSSVVATKSMWLYHMACMLPYALPRRHLE